MQNGFVLHSFAYTVASWNALSQIITDSNILYTLLNQNLSHSFKPAAIERLLHDHYAEIWHFMINT